MRRLIYSAAAFFACAALASAQDFNKAATMATEANAALEQGNYEAAIKGFTAAAQEFAKCTEDKAPEFLASCKQSISQALYDAANRLINEGKLNEAIDGLTTAIATAKEYACIEIENKAINRKQQLIKSYANNRIKAAAVANSSEEKIAYYSDALAKFEMLINEGLDDAITHLQKGQILKVLGRKQEAIDSFLKAKEMGAERSANTNLSKIYIQDAITKKDQKDYSSAIESALKAMEYEESATAYRIAGEIANASGRFEEAVNYLSKYLELAPNAKDAAQIKLARDKISSQIKK